MLLNDPLYLLIAGEALLLSLGVNGFLLFRSRRLARQHAADAERRATLLRAMEDEIRKVEAEAQKAGQVQTPQGERDRRLASAKLTSLRGALAAWKKADGDAGEVWRALYQPLGDALASIAQPVAAEPARIIAPPPEAHPQGESTDEERFDTLKKVIEDQWQEIQKLLDNRGMLGEMRQGYDAMEAGSTRLTQDLRAATGRELTSQMRDEVISHLDSVKFQWKKSIEQLEDRNTLLQQKQNDFQNQLVRSNADTVIWLSRERFDTLNGERQRLEIQNKLMTQRLEQETARAEVLESKQQTLKKEYMKLYQTFATFRASRGVSAAKSP